MAFINPVTQVVMLNEMIKNEKYHFKFGQCEHCGNKVTEDQTLSAVDFTEEKNGKVSLSYLYICEDCFETRKQWCKNLLPYEDEILWVGTNNSEKWQVTFVEIVKKENKEPDWKIRISSQNSELIETVWAPTERILFGTLKGWEKRAIESIRQTLIKLYPKQK